MNDPLLRDAKKLHAAGRLLDAAGLYQRILRGDPKHFEALYGLGMAHAQTGRLNEGERALEQALASNPEFAEGWRARGLMLMHLGRIEDALNSLDRALAIQPDFADAQAARAAVLAELTRAGAQLAVIDSALAQDAGDAARWNSRGSLLAGMGRSDEALESFDKALAIRPDFVEAQCNRATLFLETGRLDAALPAFDSVLIVQPQLAIGWNNRGNTLAKMARFEEAVTSYDRALALRPEFADAAENRDFALFALGRNVRGPAKYMRGLFDEFSSHYDETMLKKLNYRAHLHLRELANRVLPRGGAPWRIMDLGCGTGLAGAVFKDVTAGGRLDGIDISPRMIEAARARGIYDALILDDLETELAQSGRSYNLIISADTMTYFGDLSRVFAGVAKRLEAGGFYLFASEAKPVETHTGADWEQTKVHRFRHSEKYLRAEAAAAELQCVEIVSCTLRHEEHQPVAGFAVALKKPAG
jgi:predicted TPR repeat methyltransferase